MGITRKQIIAAAKQSGFEGSVTDPVAVKSHITSEIESGSKFVVGSDELTGDNFDTAWSNVQTITLNTVNSAADRTEAANVAAKSGGINRVVVDPDDFPQSFSIGNSAKKSFNRLAAAGQTALPDADTAEVFGAWARKAIMSGAPHIEYAQKSLDEEICRKANVTYNFAEGGFVIPESLESTLINIRSQYRALAQLMGTTPIPPAGTSVPRRTSGVTVYSPGEGVAPTESNVAGDQVKLTPFQMVALSTVSRLQLAASVINFGDFIANEMAYAIDKKAEEIFFLGDGTSTYFNQQGIIGKYSQLVVGAGGTWTTNAEYAAGIVRGSGNLWSELTDDDLIAMQGRLQDTEDASRLFWVCSRPFYYNVMRRIAKAKGGVTATEVVNGVPFNIYDGIPVVFSNTMPQRAANGSVCCHLGEFSTCTKIGRVPGMMTLSTSDQRYWEMGKIGYKIEDYRAQNIHDIGDASATEASRNPRPFASLITAES